MIPVCRLPPATTTRAVDNLSTALAAPVDLEWVTARLSWTQSRPPALQPTASEWREWWRQCRLVPQGAWKLLEFREKPFWLVCREPITSLSFLEHLKDVVVSKYPDGRPFKFSELPALGTPCARLDLLTWTSSVALIPHEVLHKIDELLGWLSLTDWWYHLWVNHAWRTGKQYLIQHRDEFFAEMGALWCLYWDQPAEFEKHMHIDVWHFFNHHLIVTRQWTARLPEG